MPIPALEEHTTQDFEDALQYVFAEYNQQKDGFMTRKEFFTFLWELKQTAKQTLNEGQMMSCWVQVSRKKDGISFEEFKEGLEICYDNQFFARENGAPIQSFNSELGTEEDPASYNTLKFKKSQGVAAFNKILEDEQQVKVEKTTGARQMTVYGQPSPNRGNQANIGAGVLPPRTNVINTPMPNSRGNLPPPVSQKPGAPLDTPTPITNFHMKMVQLQKEKDTKKQDAQKKMDQILSERYQEQRRQREEERKRLEDEKSRQREDEMQALNSEPAWMANLKNKQKRY